MFKGRYWTIKNKHMVMVHGPHISVLDGFGGHNLRFKEEDKDDIELVWDTCGNCISVKSTIGNIYDIRDFDLQKKVNPQSAEGQRDIVGCMVCSNERKEKLGIRDSTPIPPPITNFGDDDLKRVPDKNIEVYRTIRIAGEREWVERSLRESLVSPGKAWECKYGTIEETHRIVGEVNIK